MVFGLLADLVVVVHLAFVLFVAVGGLLVWRWPWLMWWHLPAVGWGIAIITIGFTCPLTPLEHYLRGRAGQMGHEGGFVDRYVEGVIYPGALTSLVQGLIATAVIVGYAGALRGGLKPRTAPTTSRRSMRAHDG
jgi:hypothetical protein